MGGKVPVVFWGLEAGTLLDTVPGVTPNSNSSFLDVSDAELRKCTLRWWVLRWGTEEHWRKRAGEASWRGV